MATMHDPIGTYAQRYEQHSSGMVTREHCEGVWQCRACTAEYGPGEEAEG